MPTKPTPQTEPVPTRARILAAAERLFAEQGYRSVSMPRIAKASGITAGAIYKHFDSKEDLFFEAVVQRSVQAVAIEAQRTPNAAAELVGIIGSYTGHRVKLLRQLAVEIHAASVHNAKVRRLLNLSLDRNVGQIRDAITAAQRNGEIDAALDPELLARSIMVFIMGLMHMETLLPQFVGDPKWRDFVENRAAALLGLTQAG
jgi:TetR/AcrR family transcriptional repressor of uid operon